MIIQPLFETERLLVRHFGPDDLDDFAALCADSEVMRYVGDGETLPCGEVARWIEICQTKYETRGYGTSAVLERASGTSPDTYPGTFVGYCGVVRAPGNDFDELIYVFHKRAWGRGYALEVGKAMLEYVFRRSPLTHIYATIYADNHASRKVAEKLGMRFEKEVVEPEGVVRFYVVERG